MNFVHGKPKNSGKRRKAAARTDYPDRYFLRVMDAGFPPNFVPQIRELKSQQEKAAEQNGKNTSGWQRDGGTVLMPGTPKWDRPGWIGAVPEGCSMAEAQAAKLPNLVVTPYVGRK